VRVEGRTPRDRESFAFEVPRGLTCIAESGRTLRDRESFAFEVPRGPLVSWRASCRTPRVKKVLKLLINIYIIENTILK